MPEVTLARLRVGLGFPATTTKALQFTFNDRLRQCLTFDANKVIGRDRLEHREPTPYGGGL